jgi:integrase
MSNKLAFTQARIRDLPLPEQGRVDYHDTKVPRLTCRVSSTGNKSFAVLKWNGQTTQRVTIGKFPELSVADAQKKAQSILVDISAGINPTEVKRKKEAEKTTLSQALESYISDRTLKPRTIKDYRYKINHDLSDWASLPVSKITEKMVLKKHKDLSLKGKTLANAAMRVLRLVLNYAEVMGMIEVSPTSILSKAKVWNKNNRRSRVIPSNQLKLWHDAVISLSNEKAKLYFLTILYMGFRSEEALSIEWQNVNLKTKVITIEDTKNGSSHTLPIPSPLIPYFKAMNTQTGGSKWVFPSTDTTKRMWLPKKQITAVIKASGVEFSSHDCRRTFATIAEAVNLPLTMIKRLMNHTTSNEVTGGYIVTEEETLREAINKIADYIQARVTQKNNVVTLKTAN